MVKNLNYKNGKYESFLQELDIIYTNLNFLF